MIRTAWPHDLPELRELFERANDAPYDLVAVAEEKCFAPGIAGGPVVRVYEQEGRIRGAAVTCGRWLRLMVVDRGARGRGVGTALLTDAESRGVTVIAAEAGNYFTPGVPAEDEVSTKFFHSRGYIETRWTWNLEVGLESIEAPGDVRRATEADEERLLQFVDREFGRIWHFEVAKAFDTPLPTAFIAEEEGVITGFAVHDVNNRGLGFFGPTGVDRSLRGRGIGGRLLLASLADLRRAGHARAVIPWTDALEFYRKTCGAEPAHRFVAFEKPQP